MYKRKIEKNNEMYLHSRYFFVSLRKSYIIMFKQLIKKINSAVFPRLQGGPLNNMIAGKAVGFGDKVNV